MEAAEDVTERGGRGGHEFGIGLASARARARVRSGARVRAWWGHDGALVRSGKRGSMAVIRARVRVRVRD